MPIIGLTDRGAAFPRIGELRKGAPKPKTGNKPGADLKHFRFTSTNQEVVSAFTEAYGDQPNAIKIFLPYQTTGENFEAWIEEWGAGSLKWRGDGQTLHIWQTPQGTYSHEPQPQPEKGGKQVGRLKVIIPELGRLAYVVALTTSIHDIIEIQSNLTAYEAMAGGLQGIPFILSRVPRMVSTPNPKIGKRTRREKWLLHIEAAPEWVQAQLSVMQQAALPSGAPDFEVDEDGVIIEGTIEPEPSATNTPKPSAPDHIPAPPQTSAPESVPAKTAHDMTAPDPDAVAMWREKVEKGHRLTAKTVAGMAAHAVPYLDNEYHALNHVDYEGAKVFTDAAPALGMFDDLVAIGTEKVAGDDK